METVELKIARVDQQSRKYVVEYNGQLCTVKQVPEQYNSKPPETINCIILPTQFGLTIEQNYVSLIKKHYDVGQEQIFDIVRANKDTYELVDSWGYTAYAERLFNIDTTITSKVRCLVNAINGKHPNVEILEALPMVTDGLIIHKSEIKEILGIDNDDYDDIINLMLQDISSELYDLKCMGWFSKNLHEISNNPELLQTVASYCHKVLEDCDFLQGLSKKERSILERRLVLILENIEFYSAARNMIDEDLAIGYIEQTLKKLQISGFLYHPRKSFHQLMFVFLLKQDLMGKYARLMFDTIRSKEFEFWKEENLSSEWIALLEYYCKNINVSENEEFQQERKENIIQALILQQALTDESTENMYDYHLNSAMLFRYASEMEVQKPKQMLDISFKNLVGVSECTAINEVRKVSDAKQLSNILYNQYSVSEDEPLSKLQYRGEKASIQIKEEGITIVPTNLDLASTDNAIATALNLWRNLQVRVPNRIKEKKVDSFTRTSEIWTEIDQQLFSREIAPNKEKVGKMFYSTGDKVKFIVRRQIGETTFSCNILDHGISAPATIDIKDIVKYRLEGVSVSAFKVDNGHSKILTGTISGNSNGVYQLNMYGSVANAIARKHKKDWETNNDYSFLCRPYHFNEQQQRYVGVDDCGIPVSIKVIDEETPWSTFSKGDVIEAGYPDKGTVNGFIQCEFTGTTTETLPGLEECFCELMTICCDDQFYPTEEEADQAIVQEQFKPMQAEHVSELISIIEQEAVLENDYLKAYNYFGFCRLLAKIIGENQKVEYFDSRLKIIQMLYKFNDTGNIDAAELTQIEKSNSSVFSQYTQLHHNMYQLKLVSCLNRPELFAYLTQLKSSTNNEELVKLANLVMAHNLLKEEGVSKEASSIYEQILDLLKLQKNETNKKYYGEESQTVEFKPSMVFPPEENMQPNLHKQSNEILMQICAFLNCGGGTLYIGVQNNGYELGVSQDLAYEEFHGSKDKYCLHLDNLIHAKLGPVASRFVTREWDKDAELDVLVVNIQNCDQVISLDGVYYERRGTSVRSVDDEKTFKSFRSKQLGNKSNKISEQKTEQVKTINVVEPESVSSKDSCETIMTSQIRNNHLHDWEERYVDDVIGYLSFLDNGKFEFHQEDQYDEDGKPLVLAIHESEKNGYLLCVYEGGYVCKVPIPEILDKTEGQQYVRGAEKKLIFACPASDNDSLMSVLGNKKDRFIRFDEVKELEEGNMTDYGEPIINTAFEDAIQFEVVSTNSLSDLKITYNKKSIGSSLKSIDGKDAKDFMMSIGVVIFA